MTQTTEDHPGAPESGSSGAPGPLGMAAELVAAPIAIARQVIPRGRSTKFYVGLGVVSALGVIEWPVAGALGVTYYLAKKQD